MARARWLGYVVAYLLWAMLLILGLWIVILSRDVFLGALAVFYAGDSLHHGWQARFLDKVQIVLAGVAWLAFMVVSEAYLREGAQRGVLARRFARVAGPAFVLLFVVDLALFLLQGASFRWWLRWLVLGGEALAGVALLVYARSSASKPRPAGTGPGRAP